MLYFIHISDPSCSQILGAIEKLIMMDMSSDMVKTLKDTEKNMALDNLETFYVVGEEEFLPVKER